jgi:hypothetical protein
MVGVFISILKVNEPNLTNGMSVVNNGKLTISMFSYIIP